MNARRKKELETEVDEHRERFINEINEFNRLLTSIEIENQTIDKLSLKIQNLEDSFSIQETKFTRKKQKKIEQLNSDLKLAKKRLYRLKNRLSTVRNILSGVDQKLVELQKINTSIISLGKWWKKERQKLAKKRFLAAEYILNNSHDIFIYSFEETGKKVVRITIIKCF